MRQPLITMSPGILLTRCSQRCGTPQTQPPAFMGRQATIILWEHCWTFSLLAPRQPPPHSPGLSSSWHGSQQCKSVSRFDNGLLPFTLTQCLMLHNFLFDRPLCVTCVKPTSTWQSQRPFLSVMLHCLKIY
jgi:hypothetical protein